MMSTPVRMRELCLRFELLYIYIYVKYDILTEYLNEYK
jgi:hypothetical protein